MIMRHRATMPFFLLAGPIALPALAQSPLTVRQDVATAAPAAGVLQEVVVTAERRVENLQNVPISATVLSGSSLASRGVTTVDALQQAAPSVAISTSNLSTFINIRGVGLDQSSPVSSPGVAFYVNGVLIPHETLISSAIYDVQSIEVLRGPQGTLAGQNSTGGAVYVVTPAPRFDRTSGYLDVSDGSFSHNRELGALNVGLDDNAAVRVAAVHDGTRSFTRNIGPSGEDPGNGTLDAVRADLALRTSDHRLRVNLRAEDFDYESDGIAVKRRNDTVTMDPFVIEQDAHTYIDRRGYRLAVELNYDLSASVRLRELTGYEDATVDEQADGDLSATAPPDIGPLGTFGGRVTQTRAAYRTLTSELNLLSTGEGPLKWVVGGFFMNDDVPNALYVDGAHTADFVSPTETAFVGETDNTSRSVFGQLNWFAAKRLELIAGARYNWDKQIFARSLLLYPVLKPFNPAYTGTPARSTSLTGTLGTNYHFTDETMLYIKASKGYKAGGNNLLPGSPDFAPEKNVLYEAGIKTEQFARHLRVNADAFRSDYTNIQLQTAIPTPTGNQPVVQNAAKAHSWGGELEVLSQFGGLGFNLGLSYLDATFSQGVCISNPDLTAVTSPGCPAKTNTQLVPAGADLPLAPKWTANGGIQYAIPLPEGLLLTPRVQGSLLSRQYATPFPSAVSVVPGHAVFDAMLTLAISDRYSIEGLVTNFTGKTYITARQQATTSLNAGTFYGAPREYSLRLLAKFGE